MTIYVASFSQMRRWAAGELRQPCKGDQLQRAAAVISRTTQPDCSPACRWLSLAEQRKPLRPC